MAEWRVSDEAFAEATRGSLLTRDQYRKIKGYSRQQMERWAASIYKTGLEDMAKALEEKVEQEAEEETKADWEDILRIIGEVKGIGAKKLEEIDRKVREAME